MTIYENKLTARQFCDLNEAVGWPKPNEKQMEIALGNTLYSVTAEIDGEIIAMGRLIGDGARMFYLQDIIVVPRYQRRGIGKEIVRRLLDYLNTYLASLPFEGCPVKVGLLAAKGKEGFYEKFGFISRPTDSLGCGMMMTINK